jgi:hypothetical protein
MSKPEELEAIQRKLDNFYGDRNQASRIFRKHMAIETFCGISSLINVLAGFIVAAGGMWIAAIVLVAIGLLLRFAEFFHGRTASRAQDDMMMLNHAIINVRRDYHERY